MEVKECVGIQEHLAVKREVLSLMTYLVDGFAALGGQQLRTSSGGLVR